MILYHFCPAHMVDGIKKKGLTLGKFPLLGDEHISFIDGFQWLTAEPDHRKQSWATSALIPYSRTAYRLTVEIPPSRIRKLHKALTFVKSLAPQHRPIVEGWRGSEDWYIYKGIIPPKWIKAVEKTGA